MNDSEIGPNSRDGRAMALANRLPRPEYDPPPHWRPGLTSFVVGVSFLFLIASWLRLLDPHTGPVGWYASVVLTLPIVVTSQGIAGVLHARRVARQAAEADVSTTVVSSESLIAVVPTIGREDTYVALTRVLHSLCTCLPTYFHCLRIDVVVEEGCAVGSALLHFQSLHPLVRVVTVPRDFQTPNGTRFKARAIHYAHLLRQRQGEARGDVWVLHMDDDTSVNPHTAAEIARFIERQGVTIDHGKHLAQGILVYPREFSRSRISWYADAVRPGCDISFFAFTTGRGKPRIGLHGELLLVRASVEAQIGWDFGSRTIVEDAEFAMRFCDAYPGRSAWFTACSYGASPATVTDFVRQRERWVWGMLTLLTQQSISLRRRLLLLPAIAIWVAAPFANPIFLVSIGLLLGDAGTTPANTLIGVICAINSGFYIWLYWEGFKINVRWSEKHRRRWWERAVVMAGTPIFAVVECMGVLCGLTQFLRGSEIRFNVIKKPV